MSIMKSEFRKPLSFIIAVCILLGTLTVTSIFSATAVGTNLALGKTATVSAQRNGSHIPTLTDGIKNTTLATARQDLPTGAQFISIDFVTLTTVSELRMYYETQPTAYTIDTSINGSTWTTQLTVSTAPTMTGYPGVIADTIPSVDCRYIRISFLSTASQWGYGVCEMEVYGTSSTGTTIEDTNTTTTSTTVADVTGTVFQCESTSYTSTAGVTVGLSVDSGVSPNISMIGLSATGIGNFIEYTLPNVAAGTYTVKVNSKNFTSRGIYQLSVNGVDQGTPKDLYAAGTNPAYVLVDFGTVTIDTTGSQKFRFSVTGKNASSSGYVCYFDYIKLIGSTATTNSTAITTSTNSTVSTSVTTTSANYSNPYKTASGKLWDLSADSNTVANFVASFAPKAGTQILVFDSTGAQVTTGSVGTGMTVKILVNNVLAEQFTVILYGDINEDGAINSLDLLKEKQHILKILTMTGDTFLAANADRDSSGSVNSLDLLMIKQHILKIVTIDQN